MRAVHAVVLLCLFVLYSLAFFAAFVYSDYAGHDDVFFWDRDVSSGEIFRMVVSSVAFGLVSVLLSVLLLHCSQPTPMEKEVLLVYSMGVGGRLGNANTHPQPSPHRPTFISKHDRRPSSDLSTILSRY